MYTEFARNAITTWIKERLYFTFFELYQELFTISENNISDATFLGIWVTNSATCVNPYL